VEFRGGVAEIMRIGVRHRGSRIEKREKGISSRKKMAASLERKNRESPYLIKRKKRKRGKIWKTHPAKKKKLIIPSTKVSEGPGGGHT